MPQLEHHQPTVRDTMPQVRAGACPSCGAPVEPLDRFCGTCGAEQPATAAAAAGAAQPPPKHFRCENCGAEVAIDPEHRSYTCPFCDSNYVVEFTPQETGRQEPEFVIGFAVPPERAMERFRRWLGRNPWFRPGDLKGAQIEGKLRGVYIPFWSFSMLAQSRWSASIGEYWYRTETYTTIENGKTVTRTRTVRETEWWSVRGGHHEYYSGYLVSGSRGLRQAEAERIKPFHLAALKRYQPYFLAGWLSEEYSVGREEALAVCQGEFQRMEQERIVGFLPGDTHRGLQAQTEMSDVGSDLILLPVYVLGYRYGSKLYRFLLNGQTGTAAGTKPVSWRRIGLAAGLGIALVAAVLVAWALSR